MAPGGSSNRAGSLGALIRNAKERAAPRLDGAWERAAPRFDAERGARLIVSALDKVDKGKTALRPAAERGAQLLGRVKAKAHGAAAAAAAAAAEVTSSGGGSGSGSPGAAGADADPKVRQICARGFTPVAARLALAHCGADASAPEACQWLQDEANAEDIFAAEAGEVWAVEQQQASAPPGDPAAEGRLGLGAAARRCSPEAFLEGEDVCLFSSDASPGPPPKDDEGLPPTTPSSTSAASRGGAGDAPTEAAGPPDAGEPPGRAGPCGPEEELMVAAAPPDGGFWEWPLSRHEKSVRLQTLEWRMAELDRKVLMEALVRERVRARVEGRTPTPCRHASHERK